MLKLINIKKKFKNNFYALQGIDFEIHKGEVVSLLGVNGAGKTTLSSIIATLHPPTEGDILFNGVSIYENIPDFRKNLGYCQQKANLNPDLTVYDNLYFAGKYFGLSTTELKNKIEELNSSFGFGNFLDHYPKMLSGGWRQRVMLARTLIHNPKIIILDEPTVALDPSIRHKLWEFIKKLKQDGITVLLTTHYIEEAEILSDRICLLDKGKVKLLDTPKNLISSFNKGKLEEVFLQLTQESEGL